MPLYGPSNSETVPGECLNNMVSVSLPEYIQSNPRTSRRSHSMTLCQLHAAKDYYKYSCSPLRTGLAILVSNLKSTDQRVRVYNSKVHVMQFVGCLVTRLIS